MDWREIETLSSVAIVDWAGAQPWADAMRACHQDKQWHAEGDVWTHTVEVCRQLETVDDWHRYTRSEQTALVFSALLHDVAKPNTTIIDRETQRVRSPGHAVKGEAMARSILRELHCPFCLREQICGLVRYHGKPVFLPHAPSPEIELAKLSWLARLDMLTTLAIADLRGRQSTGSDRSEDDLVWFRTLAQENGCLDRPYPLPNDHSRFLLGRGELDNLHYEPFEDYRCTATLMSGLPGSGKDTWLLRNRPGLPVVSLDAIRLELGIKAEANQGTVIQAARERCRQHLRSETSFAFNATNTSRQMRTRWISLFAKYSARVEIVEIENTLQETLTQNRDRDDSVPDSVIRRLYGGSEPAHALEGHNVQQILSDRLLPDR